MPPWLVNTLGFIYKRLPASLRPPLSQAFKWGFLRFQALAGRRSVEHGQRVQYVNFEIAELDRYEFLGPGDQGLLVEAIASCVSPGTERAVLMGLPGSRRPFPYAPGYSMVGKVVRTGRRVKGFAAGDIVAGRMSHASRGVMNAETTFKIPPRVSADEAAFIELGIITLQGIRKAHIRPGDRVAVIGQGLIGQLGARLARIAGADPVIAVASSRRRAETALAGGWVDEFLSQADEPGRIRALAADIVIEAVGSARAITSAMEAARPGGTVVLLGSSRDLGRNLDWWTLAQEKNLTLVGAHISGMPSTDASPRRWPYRDEGRLFLDLLGNGALRLSDLITWRPMPEDCNAVYEALAEGGRHHVGVVFQWAKSGARP
jgi:2-desacetyl-2-hydroxyethyl bacteriochlorophyllide A dehydrogenase